MRSLKLLELKKYWKIAYYWQKCKKNPFPFFKKTLQMQIEIFIFSTVFQSMLLWIYIIK